MSKYTQNKIGIYSDVFYKLMHTPKCTKKMYLQVHDYGNSVQMYIKLRHKQI